MLFADGGSPETWVGIVGLAITNLTAVLMAVVAGKRERDRMRRKIARQDERIDGLRDELTEEKEKTGAAEERCNRRLATLEQDRVRQLEIARRPRHDRRFTATNRRADMVGLLERDTLDDRREIRRLLDFVKPADRWVWLQWVSRMPAVMKGDVMFDALDRRMTREAHWGCEKANKYVSNTCYRLAFQLASQYSLDWGRIERGLTLLARGQIRADQLRHVK